MVGCVRGGVEGGVGGGESMSSKRSVDSDGEWVQIGVLPLYW